MQRTYAELLKEAPELNMTGNRKLTKVLHFDSCTLSTPSPVRIGGYKGFSLPIWSSSGATATEQVYFQTKVPNQWDEKSSATLKLLIGLGATQSTPTQFRVSCLWNAGNVSTLASSSVTVTDNSDDIPVVDGSLDIESLYEPSIQLSLTDLTAGDYISGKIRRIANSDGAGSEITDEIMILGGVLEWKVNKIFGT